MTTHGVFRSMVWKDYRELRAFWLATVLLALALQSIVGTMTARPGMAPYTLIPMLGWALVTPSLYALGCAAMMFAGEHESGTYDFLRTMPVKPLRLLAGRTAFVLATTLLMLATTCGSFVLLRRISVMGPRDIAQILGCFAVVPLEMFIYGTFFSLASRRPLPALVLGATFGVCTPTAIVLAFKHSGHFESAAQWWLPALAVRLAVAGLVAAIDVRLAMKWFRDMGARPSGRLEQPVSTRRESTSEFGRLLWQQWRQSWRLATVFIPATLVAVVLSVVAIHPLASELPRALLVLLLVPMAGVCVFREDWREDRYRLLAECGASPGRVWLTRQLVWFGVSMAILLVVVPTMTLTQSDSSFSRYSVDLRETTFGGLVPCFTYFVPTGYDCVSTGTPAFALFVAAVPTIVMLAAYACGQFCSIYTRSSIVAGVTSYGLLLAMTVWATVMSALWINWLWSFLPIPLVLLLATRLRTRDWMLGRTDWRARLRAVLVPLLPVVAILVAVPFYRVYSVQNVTPKFPTRVIAPKPTPEELATARIYAKAYATYVPLIHEDDEKERNEASASRLWDVRPSEGIAWFAQPSTPAKFIARLKANRKTIDETVRASRRPTCLLRSPYLPHLDNSMPDSQSVQDLGTLLVIDARYLTTEGRLDEALDRYLAAIRVANHLYQSGAANDGDWLYRMAEWGMLCWAAVPDQTAERIGRALKEFTKIEMAAPSLDYAVAHDWRRSRKQVAEVHSWRGPHPVTDHPGKDWAQLTQAAALRWFPWERTRAYRIIDYLACLELENVRLFETSLRQNQRGDERILYSFQTFGVDALVDSTSFAGPVYRMETSSWFEITMSNVARDRAFRLQLALVAWRRSHGKVPDSLDELVGTYLDAVPVDPFTGKRFQYYPQGLPEREYPPGVEPIVPGGYRAPAPPESRGPLVWSPRTSGASEPYLQDGIDYSDGRIFPVP